MAKHDPGRERPTAGMSEVDTALDALRDRGYVVIENVLAPARVAALVAALADNHRVKPLKPHQAHLPLVPPFTDDDVARHPRVLALVHAGLGNDLMIGPVGLHRQNPGDRASAIHRDRRQLFDLPMALPVYSLVAQIALTDFRRDNGATELWPGSQWLPDEDAYDRAGVTSRAGTMPSVALEMSAGDVCVRDARLWHRAGVNSSTTERTMLVVRYERDFQQSNLVRLRGRRPGRRTA